MTVGELITKLKDMPQDVPVHVWMPGTYVGLKSVFVCDGDLPYVLIEGNQHINPTSKELGTKYDTVIMAAHHRR